MLPWDAGHGHGIGSIYSLWAREGFWGVLTQFWGRLGVVFEHDNLWDVELDWVEVQEQVLFQRLVAFFDDLALLLFVDSFVLFWAEHLWRDELLRQQLDVQWRLPMGEIHVSRWLSLILLTSGIFHYFTFDKVVGGRGEFGVQVFFEKAQLWVLNFLYLERFAMAADFSVFKFGLEGGVVLALLAFGLRFVFF